MTEPDDLDDDYWSPAAWERRQVKNLVVQVPVDMVGALEACRQLLDHELFVRNLVVVGVIGVEEGSRKLRMVVPVLPEEVVHSARGRGDKSVEEK